MGGWSPAKEGPSSGLTPRPGCGESAGAAWRGSAAPLGTGGLRRRHRGPGLEALGGSCGELPHLLPGHPDALTHTPDPRPRLQCQLLPTAPRLPRGLAGEGMGQRRLPEEHWPGRRPPLTATRPPRPGPPARLAGGQSLRAPSQLLRAGPRTPHPRATWVPMPGQRRASARRLQPGPCHPRCQHPRDSRGRHATSSPTAGSCPDTHTCPDLTPADGRTGLGTRHL